MASLKTVSDLRSFCRKIAFWLPVSQYAIKMTQKTKICMVGAGSFVFSLGLLEDLIFQHPLEMELVLIDINEEAARRMAGVAQQMALQAGNPVQVHWSTTLEDLQGADFVTCAAAIQLHGRYTQDREVLARHGIQELLGECGGVGGLIYALRTGTLVLNLAQAMEKWCPNALLLNASNPLPRVVSAVTQHTSIRTVGFCNVAHGGNGGYHNVAGLLGRPLESLKVKSAGINHFAFLVSVQDRTSGENLMPEVHRALSEGAWQDRPLTRELYRQTGALPLSGDSHFGEFLPFDSSRMTPLHAHHGTPEERQARMALLDQVAAGKASYLEAMEGRSWEHPGTVIHALVTGTPLELDMLNLPNQDFLQGFPENAVVEVPSRVENGTITAESIWLPEGAFPHCQRLSEIVEWTGRAVGSGDAQMLQHILELDPAVVNKGVAWRALQELLQVHRDVLPQFQ